jgi:hypothetical protein
MSAVLRMRAMLRMSAAPKMPAMLKGLAEKCPFMLRKMSVSAEYAV